MATTMAMAAMVVTDAMAVMAVMAPMASRAMDTALTILTRHLTAMATVLMPTAITATRMIIPSNIN